jgi:hypothetical protein
MAQPADFLERFKKDPKSLTGPALLPPPRKPNGARDAGLIGKGFGGGVGLQPRYATPDALSFAVEAYFMAIELEDEPPTVAGLALALGFSSTTRLKAYAERNEDYEYYIERAITRMEAWKNKLLLKGGPTTQGAIFDLKNQHKWADKVEQQISVDTTGSLSALVQALQGQVLRPVLNTPREETVVNAVDYDALTQGELFETEEDLPQPQEEETVEQVDEDYADEPQWKQDDIFSDEYELEAHEADFIEISAAPTPKTELDDLI